MIPALALVATATVTAHDAERLGRMLDALAAYESDQRRFAGFVSLGTGGGVALAGAVLASDSSIPDTDRAGPILIGAGATMAALGALLFFIEGDAEALAETYASELSPTSLARTAAVRSAEARLLEVHEDYATSRTWLSVASMILGAGTTALGGAILAESRDPSVRSTVSVAMGAGIGTIGLGIYLLATGETPVERFIDGYTPVTVPPSSSPP